MGVNVAGTIAGLDALVSRVDRATLEICVIAAHIFQGLAAEYAPVGEGGNSTNAPGDLARSMEVDGPVGGDGFYEARVGPTVVSAHPGPGGTVLNYGRIRELGGEIVPKVSKSLVFTKYGQTYRVARVTQVGRHYLLRARTEGEPTVMAMVEEKVAAAVEGK